jgi:predicted anti-sigma-YlaC factor YlaD
MTGRIMSRACDRARAHISAQLDGELSEFERARLTLHLAGCPACRAYQADVVGVTELVRAAPLEPLEFPISLPRRRRSAFRQLELAAAVALAATIGLGSMFSALGTSRSSQLFGSSQSVRPAYLDSSDYEQRLIEKVARSVNDRVRMGGAVHV